MSCFESRTKMRKTPEMRPRLGATGFLSQIPLGSNPRNSGASRRPSAEAGSPCYPHFFSPHSSFPSSFPLGKTGGETGRQDRVRGPCGLSSIEAELATPNCGPLMQRGDTRRACNLRFRCGTPSGCARWGHGNRWSTHGCAVLRPTGYTLRCLRHPAAFVHHAALQQGPVRLAMEWRFALVDLPRCRGEPLSP
jgi:hypothetical protein